MKFFYGVNSIVPANQKLKNGYTLFDWVRRQKGYPKFWTRTLLGENAITEEEIKFLKENNCKILLAVRNFTEKELSKTYGGEEAIKVVNAAKALGVPTNRGIAIAVDIKPDMSVNHNWMLSFASVLASHGYIPGFIGNTDSSKNYNFDRQYSHYIQATREVDHYGAIVMATEPKVSNIPGSWAPYCPSQLEPEQIDLWCCGKTVLGKVEAEDVYLKDLEVLRKMW